MNEEIFNKGRSLNPDPQRFFVQQINSYEDLQARVTMLKEQRNAVTANLRSAQEIAEKIHTFYSKVLPKQLL